MTELELAWKEYTDALEACHKYSELVVMNIELCFEACLDVCHYTEKTLKCMREIKEGFESFML